MCDCGIDETARISPDIKLGGLSAVFFQYCSILFGSVNCTKCKFKFMQPGQYDLSSVISIVPCIVFVEFSTNFLLKVNKSAIYPFSSYLELAVFSDSSSNVISMSPVHVSFY